LKAISDDDEWMSSDRLLQADVQAQAAKEPLPSVASLAWLRRPRVAIGPLLMTMVADDVDPSVALETGNGSEGS